MSRVEGPLLAPQRLSCTFAAIHMETGKGSLSRDAIRTALAPRVGLPNADATVEASAATWRLVAAQLAPVIGARGLEVLFRRALHKTTAAFPWIAADLESGGIATSLP